MKGNAGRKNDSKKKQWNNLSSNLTTSHILTASKGLRQKDYSTESDPYAFNERDSPLMVTQPSKQKPPRKWYEQDVPGLKEKQPRVYTVCYAWSTNIRIWLPFICVCHSCYCLL